MARTLRARTVALVTVAAVVVVAVVAVVTWRAVRGHDDQTPLQHAMSRALDDGQRFSWTDWAGVRKRLDLPLDVDSTTAEVHRLLSKGFDADLTSTSALVTSAGVLQQDYDFSPASLSWELYSQSDTAAVEMLGLGPSNDVDDIEQALRSDGYKQPATSDGVWAGNLDDIKRLGEVTPELTYLSIDRADGIILGSDDVTGIHAGIAALKAAKGPGGGVADVVAALGDPVTAEVYSSDQVCSALAMSQADDSDAAAGEQLIAAAGKVNPLTGFAMGDEADGTTHVAMAFDGNATAKVNAVTRAKLASGPAPGQGGSFTDRYTLGRVSVTGPVVTMVLHPKPDQYVLSDLDTGPLLFATC